jgi:hypothetical protein
MAKSRAESLACRWIADEQAPIELRKGQRFRALIGLFLAGS